MKFNPTQIAAMQEIVTSFLSEVNADGQLVAAYENGNFARANTVKDLQMRFCFDIFYQSNLKTWFRDNITDKGIDVNDDHLYTALKRICPTVTRRYSIAS